MGRREKVTYVCDWCDIERPPAVNSYSDDAHPHGWEEHDGVLLCLTCSAVRTEKLAEARAMRHRVNATPSPGTQEKT
jgi:hypothetical protein